MDTRNVDTVISSAPPPTLAFLLGTPASPDEPLAYWIDGQLTRAQLRAAATEVAQQLRASGVGSRQPVAHIVESGVTALTVMFGVWFIDAVYVPINGRLTDAEIAAQLTATRPAAVVARSERETLDDSLTWIVEEPAGRWRRRPAATPWNGDLLPPGTALVMRTSGTTGTAKPVVLGHDSVAEGIDTVLSSLRTKSTNAKPSQRPKMPNLIPASLALWAGIWNVLFALRSGAAVVVMDRFDTVEFATLIRRHQIRSTILAPAMMAMLVEDPRVSDLAPLTMVRSITAPLTPQQARAFKAKFGIGIMNCYGQTELGGEVVGWTAADLREHGDDKLGSVGRPHKGIEVRILDDNGAEVPRGEVGEIWIRSPYASRDEAVTAGLIDGFLRTGDIGRLDEDGFLWLDGRASEVINRGGLKVLPQEVEEQLCALPEVAEACVAGVPDARLGQVPVAWVRLAAGARIEPPELLARLRTTLAGYKVPVALEVVDELPRNEIGKVLRRALVEQWLSGQAGTGDT